MTKHQPEKRDFAKETENQNIQSSACNGHGAAGVPQYATEIGGSKDRHQGAAPWRSHFSVEDQGKTPQGERGRWPLLGARTQAS